MIRQRTYGKMDFNTRDRYRHVVERLSRSSSQPEVRSGASTRSS